MHSAHSDSLTWKWTIVPWKTTFLYDQGVFHFHVSRSVGVFFCLRKTPVKEGVILRGVWRSVRFPCRTHPNNPTDLKPDSPASEKSQCSVECESDLMQLSSHHQTSQRIVWFWGPAALHPPVYQLTSLNLASERPDLDDKLGDASDPKRASR